MRVLIFGGSGMLGPALVKAGEQAGHEVIAPTRAEVDLTSDSHLEECIEDILPDCIINAAAMIHSADCDENPRSAYMVNARPVAILANACREREIPLIQISSDQCAGPLLNEYAITKAAGEAFALSIDHSLVVRTNIVGPKNLAWAFNAIEQNASCVLYSDYIVSSIDIWSFSEALFEMLREPSTGIINLASREAFSKEDFVRGLAGAMGRPLTKVVSAPLPKAANRHPEQGLDVSLAEEWLGHKLPTMQDVITRILKERQVHENW